MEKAYVRPLDLRHGTVDLSHGGGGRAMVQLIGEIFGRAFDNEWLRRGDDGARGALAAGAPVHPRRPGRGSGRALAAR